MKLSYILILILISILFLLIVIYFQFKKRTEINIKKQMPDSVTITNLETRYISPISIDYLRSLKIDSDKLKIEEELTKGSNYNRYIASYISEGNKIYGLLTIPDQKQPEGGFPAIVFNHGYISPKQYKTTENYIAYVDSLAKNGFVVFKIDYRGNGDSEGDSSGTYFSSAYTIDAISALKSLQKYEHVNPEKIGMWGHSMAGNLVLRAMLVSGDIKAGVIWSGAVYSYEDFVKYKINDSSYIHKPFESKTGQEQQDREVSPEIQKIRADPELINFDDEFWSSVSLTKNIRYLTAPLQIDHAVDDPVVTINYSRDLADVLKENNKKYEFNEYPGGGHNIISPYFEQAVEDTVKFFKENL